MNFTYSDLFVTMSMATAVIFMSFTFPALGMTGDSVNETDIPQFNISKGVASFAREEPEYPNRPSEGTLQYKNGSADWEDNRQVDLQTGDPRYVLSFFDRTKNEPNPTYEVNLINFSGSTSQTIDVDINESESKTITSADGAYEIGIRNLQIVNNTTGYEEATVEWEVISQPSDATWLGRIPIVGSIVSGANQLASVVGWIASMLWYFIIKFLVITANALLMFFNVFVFMVDLMVWLITTYAGIVTGAPTSWAGVIVAIPGLLLSFEFAKLIGIAISLLPLT